MRGIGDRHRMLRRAAVARANRADVAVAPGLLADPLGGVEAIGGIVAQWRPAAFGFVAAADILHDDGVAGGHEGFVGIGAASPAIGSAGQDDGEFAFRAGQIDIGGEFDAVAHGNAHKNLARAGKHEKYHNRQSAEEHGAVQEYHS